MTMPISTVTVVCPKCGKSYEDWYRGSYNETLGEKWDDDYLDRASSAVCPDCGHKVYFDMLIVSEDGMTWRTR